MIQHPMQGNMSLGFSLRPGWVESSSHAELFVTLKNLGIEAVETPITVEGEYDLQAVREAQEHGLLVSFHATGPLWHTFQSEHKVMEMVQRTLSLIDSTAALTDRPVVLNVHPAEDAPSRAGNLALTLDSLATTTSIIEAEGLNVIVSLENLPYDPWAETRIGNDPAEILSIVEEVRSPFLGATWDLAHYEGALCSHAIPDRLGDEFYSQVRHVHVSDWAPGHGDHLPLGYGTVPYCDYLLRLREEKTSIEDQEQILVVMEIDLDKAAAFGSPVGGVLESARRFERCLFGRAART